MAKVIVVGHGGYGTAIKNILAMIYGKTEGFTYVDFNLEDDVNTLTEKINAAVGANKGEDILFATDLAGGSPFKQCAVLCMEHPSWVTVAGISIAALAEMVYNLNLKPDELANLALEVTKSAVMRFPEKPEQ